MHIRPCSRARIRVRSARQREFSEYHSPWGVIRHAGGPIWVSLYNRDPEAPIPKLFGVLDPGMRGSHGVCFLSRLL